ncbi:MAG TPA: hypothetical protein VJM12_15395 [Pyrinomonadaceae bacterium]|nr:hypothetical protein [Pyrinomonadaceae bacterium]
MIKVVSFLLTLAGISLLIASVPSTIRSTPNPRVSQDSLSPEVLQQLASARAATAKYHDVSQAEADGYINTGFCEPSEGCHWLNPSLIDAQVDPAHPEILLYVPGPGESGLRLVALEYIVPLSLSPGSPSGFPGNPNTWREDTEGFATWELTVWLWMHNPNGLFEQHNPFLP